VIIAAALLHDTIEDTETRPEELRGAFGASVTVVVGCPNARARSCKSRVHRGRRRAPSKSSLPISYATQGISWHRRPRDRRTSENANTSTGRNG
jgi:hypothetical protein